MASVSVGPMVEPGTVATPKLIQDVQTWNRRSQGLEIVDPVTYEVACEELKALKALQQQVTDTFNPHIQQAHKLHRGLTEERRKHLTPLQLAETVYKAKIGGFQRAEERKRQQEQRRLEELAKKQRDDDALALAESLDKAGATEQEVEAVLTSTEMPAPVVTVQPRIAKVAGVSSAPKWIGEIYDFKLLVATAATNELARSLLQVDEKALRAFARNTKGSVAVPGVKFREDSIVRAGRG